MNDFHALAPMIAMRDPLAEFLGAAAGGRLEYAYADAVKLTGHSCPTVAGAYLATLEALAALYPGETPERGAIRVELRERAEEGVAGVVAGVATLITGAAGEGGFKGIAGRFERRGLLSFGAPIAADLRFTRLDTSHAVEVDLPRAASSPELVGALRRALAPEASAAERDAFARAWQARVAGMFPSTYQPSRFPAAAGTLATPAAPISRTRQIRRQPTEEVMRFEIPKPLQIEHEELHAKLVEATKEPGAVGEAAREVARLLHPHFVSEEDFALPPLALLSALARGEVTPDMAEVLPMTRRLKAELPAMLAEHKQIVGALEKLRGAAHAAERSEYERFADALVLHAQTEEQVLYPAAILVGEYVARTLQEAVGTH